MVCKHNTAHVANYDKLTNCKFSSLSLTVQIQYVLCEYTCRFKITEVMSTLTRQNSSSVLGENAMNPVGDGRKD